MLVVETPAKIRDAYNAPPKMTGAPAGRQAWSAWLAGFPPVTQAIQSPPDAVKRKYDVSGAAFVQHMTWARPVRAR